MGPIFLTALTALGGAGPHPSRFVASDVGRPRFELFRQALVMAPSGSRPWVRYRHKAIISLRAKATIMVRRMRPLPAVVALFASHPVAEGAGDTITFAQLLTLGRMLRAE